MHCTGCAAPNPEAARFCNQCGAPLPAACPECQSPNPPDARFCNHCGGALTTSGTPPSPASSAARQSPPPTPARSPVDYTPRHLADRILRSRSALEGERKVVTVLFADVKGSMELAESLGPDAWHEVLDRFFDVLGDSIHRFEGTINQYTGDGIMALFGAPIAHEDHAQRACLAGLQLKDTLREFSRSVKREYGVDFETRVGINSGDVVVGKIGSDLRMDYTAQGHSVGLAQRMEALASAGSVYAAPSTVALAEGYFEFEDLGEFKVKGVETPTRAFELLGLGAARTRFDLSVARGLTRFVGRRAEMEILETALERARAGNGQVVGVVAEAGTGKSRLCHEFSEQCRARGLRVIEGRCVAHGKTLPFLPVLEIIRAYYGIGEQDDARTAREKIAGRMLLFDESYREVLPVLFDFLGYPDPTNPAPPLPPEARQRQLFGVLHELVHAGAGDEEDVSIVLVEDLHWIDSGSDQWIEQWVDATAGSRTLLVLNFRPEYHAHWMQRVHYQQLALAPLSGEAIRELLGDLIGADETTEGLAEIVHAHTAGNPFFAEEVVQMLIESGQLQGERGAYRLTRPIEGLRVPRNVQALLAARIDGLDANAKLVLQAASIIGKEFDEPTLRRVTDLDEPTLRDVMAVLRAGEFVYEKSLFPVAEYTFKHPLTQAVAADSMLVERRRALHAAIARYIEGRTTDPDANAALLAHHWAGAGDPRRAAEWHLRAAAWIGSKDVGQMATHARSVLELLREDDTAPENARLLARACAVLANLGWRLGGGEETDRIFEDGRRWARIAGDPATEGQVLAGRAAVAALAGRLREASEVIVDFIEVADRAGDPDISIFARTWAAYPEMKMGKLAEALERCHWGLSEMETRPEVGLDVLGTTLKGLAIHWQFELECMTAPRAQAFATIEWSLRWCREHRELESEATAHATRTVWLGWMFGDREPLLPIAYQALKLAEQLDTPLSRSFSTVAMACALCSNGRFDESLEMIDRSLEISNASQINLEDIGQALSIRGLALLGLERVDEAHRQVEEAIRRVEEHEIGSQLPMVLDTLARTTLVRGDIAASAAAADRMERVAEEIGALNYRPHVAWRRAEIALAAGDTEAAETQLRLAHSLFEAIGGEGHASTIQARLDAMG